MPSVRVYLSTVGYCAVHYTHKVAMRRERVCKHKEAEREGEVLRASVFTV